MSDIKAMLKLIKAANNLSSAMVLAESQGVDFDKVDTEWTELTAALQPFTDILQEFRL